VKTEEFTTKRVPASGGKITQRHTKKTTEREDRRVQKREERDHEGDKGGSGSLNSSFPF
jgi:hypothetical protein